MLPLQMPFPSQSMGHDPIEIIELWFPSELGSQACAGGHDDGGIAGPTRRYISLERYAAHASHCLDNFPDSIAMAVAAIVQERVLSQLKAVESQQVGGNQVGDVNIVPNSGPVAGGVV